MNLERHYYGKYTILENLLSKHILVTEIEAWRVSF